MVMPILNKETANGHIAIVRAMSLKTMLIANMTKGIEDYLLPNENCLLIPDDDIEPSIHQIRHAMTPLGGETIIIENAYRFAQKHFSVSNDIEVINELARV
jgi:hypothetical protein